VIPPHRSPKAPKDADWRWSGSDHLDDLIEERGWRTVADAHTWYDDAADDEHDPPHRKGAYKLPHHVLVDGRLEVVWSGVTAAMTVVNGARGGVDIPEADRKQVYEHLARHYEEFDEEPPPMQ
jgi:hypothetical protein